MISLLPLGDHSKRKRESFGCKSVRSLVVWSTEYSCRRRHFVFFQFSIFNAGVVKLAPDLCLFLCLYDKKMRAIQQHPSPRFTLIIFYILINKFMTSRLTFSNIFFSGPCQGRKKIKSEWKFLATFLKKIKSSLDFFIGNEYGKLMEELSTSFVFQWRHRINNNQKKIKFV